MDEQQQQLQDFMSQAAQWLAENPETVDAVSETAPQAAAAVQEGAPDFGLSFDADFAAPAAEVEQPVAPVAQEPADVAAPEPTDAVDAPQVNWLTDTVRGLVRGPVEAFESMASLVGDIVTSPASDETQTQTRAVVGSAFDPFKAIAPNSTLGKVAEGMTQFLTGFFGPGKFVVGGKLLAGAGSLTKGVAQGAAADFLAFDATEERLSNLIVDAFPESAPDIVRWMAAKEDDHWLGGRAKNVLEGGIAGAGTDLAIRGLSKTFQGLATGVRRYNLTKQFEDLSAEGIEATTKRDAIAAAIRELDPTATTPKPSAVVAQEVVDFIDASARVVRNEPTETDIQLIRGFVERATAKIDAAPISKIVVDEARATEAMEKISNTRGETLGHRDTLGWSDADLETFRGRVKAAASGELPHREIFADMPINPAAYRTAKDGILHMQAITEAASPELLKEFSEVQSWAMAKEMAGELGRDPNQLWKQLQSFSAKAEDIASINIAARSYYLGAVSAAGRASKAVAAGNMTLDEARPAIENAVRALAVTKNIMKNLGRGLNVSKLPVSPLNLDEAAVDVSSEVVERQVKALEDAFNRLGESGETEVFAKILANAGKDPKTAIKALNWATSGKPVQMLNELWISAILSGPLTQQVNIASTLMHGFTRPTLTALGHTVQAAGNLAVGRVGSMNAHLGSARKEMTTYAGLLHAWRDAARMAKIAWQEERTVLDTVSWVEEANHTAIPGLTGKILRAPAGRALQMEDEFFKQLYYRARVYADATDEALKLNLSKKRQDTPLGKMSEFEQFVRNKVEQAFTRNDPVLPDGIATNQAALDWARRSTFTTPMEAGSWGAWMQQRTRESPLAVRLTPFVRTGTNLLLEGWYNTPMLGAFSSKQLQRMRTPEGRAEIIGQQMLAVSLLGPALMLASNKQITGGGPRDPDMQKLWRETHEPYSIRVGDKWVSYKWAEPYATWLGVVASVGEVWEDLDDHQKDEAERGLVLATVANLFGDEADESAEAADRLQTLGSRGFLSASRTILDKHYFSGLNDFLDVAMAGAEGDGKAANFLWKHIASNIPFSGMLKQTNPDPYLREVHHYLDNLKTGLPGWSETLDPKFNFLGQPVQKSGSYLSRAFILKPTDANDEPLWQEIGKLNAKFAPPMTKLDNVDLVSFVNPETGKNAWRTWNELIGTVKNGRGQTLEESLTALVQSKRYQERGSTSFKDVVAGMSYEGTAEALVRNEIEAFRKLAWRKVIDQPFASGRGLPLKQALRNDLENKRRSKRGITELLDLK